MLSDLKFAFRSLLKAPGFTLIAILTLALGIGATTTIFSAVSTVLLKPLPYAQPESLVRIYTEMPTLGLRRTWASAAEYLEVKRNTQFWQSLDAWMDSGGGAHLATGDKPRNVTIAYVTGGALSSLGVNAMLGRLITPEDDKAGASLVAVLSERLWRNAFNADPAILGRNVLVNGKKHTVIGVMPANFSFPPGQADEPEMWTPLQIDAADPLYNIRCHWRWSY